MVNAIFCMVNTHLYHGQHTCCACSKQAVLRMVNTASLGSRYPHTKDACCLTALSLSLRSKAHPRLWSAQGLPSDAHRLFAVPSGGALVVCLNHILYYKQVCLHYDL